MFKASLLALALFAGTASAAENAQVTTTIQSKLMHEGVVVSEDVSVGLGMRFSDVLLDGVFVRTDFNSVTLSPLSDSLSVRSDLGVGYAGSNWEASLNRVMNPVVYAGDYTDARFRATHGGFFTELKQGLTTGVNKDTYLSAGIEQDVAGITVGGLVSAVRYDTAGVTVRDEVEFNNAEVFARYNVWRDLDVNVNYSYGGRDRAGRDIGNQVWGGLTYRF
jgi:hypothetical protein